MPEVYRSAASVLVLRPGEGGSHEMLLLHKPRKRDAWQLPQGGVESGEGTADAALRELFEEAGLRDCRVLGVSGKVYQYDFPPGYRRFRPDNVRGQRIEFIFALAPKGAEVTVDGKEIDAYVWTGPSGLAKYLKRKPYRQLVDELFEDALRLL